MRKPGFFTRLHRFIITPLWRPGVKHLFFFSLGLRSIISAGIPIIQAFEIMAQSTRHRLLQQACLSVSQDLAGGIPMEKAIRYHKKVFTPFFVNIFMAGLRSGTPEECLTILVDHYSSLMELKGKILQTLIYPLANLILGTFIMIFRDLAIMFMNHAFNWREAMPIIIGYAQYPLLGIFMPFLLAQVAKDPRIRPVTDNVLVNLPLFGTFYRRYSFAIFFRIFATGVEAGHHIRDSFRDALEGMNNYYLAKKLKVAEKYLEYGERISEAFDLTGVFEPQALGMVGAGELSGSLPEICRRMADYYREEVINLLPGIIKASFPFFMVLVAIAFFVTPVFLFVATFLACFLIFLAV
jgi:type IV pilus assembly protein PilC